MKQTSNRTDTRIDRRTNGKKVTCAFLLGLLTTGCGQAEVDVLCADYFSTGDIAGYEAVGDRFVRHSESGVLWYRCAVGQRFEGNKCVGEPSLASGEEATAAIAGFADQIGVDATAWTLPNQSDYATITNEACHTPKVNVQAFPQAGTGYYLAAGEGKADNLACGVRFADGVSSCVISKRTPRPLMMVKKDQELAARE